MVPGESKVWRCPKLPSMSLLGHEALDLFNLMQLSFVSAVGQTPEKRLNAHLGKQIRAVFPFSSSLYHYSLYEHTVLPLAFVHVLLLYLVYHQTTLSPTKLYYTLYKHTISK